VGAPFRRQVRNWSRDDWKDLTFEALLQHKFQPELKLHRFNYRIRRGSFHLSLPPATTRLMQAQAGIDWLEYLG
jgi:hypothetical protein